MREDTIVEQATAKEITHEDVEMVRRFGAEFRRADESYVSALSLMAPVFELPLSDVTVVDGEKAVLGCRVAVTPAAEVYLVSIVREVEREMESISRPAPKSSTRRTDPHASAAPLNYDDRKTVGSLRNTDRRRRRRLAAAHARPLICPEVTTSHLCRGDLSKCPT